MQLSLAQLKASFLTMTDAIQQEIEANNLDAAVTLLQQQLNLIGNIIVLSNDKNDLWFYLNEVHVRYQNMIQKVSHERDQIQNTLGNLTAVKKYFTSDS